MWQHLEQQQWCKPPSLDVHSCVIPPCSLTDGPHFLLPVNVTQAAFRHYKYLKRGRAPVHVSSPGLSPELLLPFLYLRAFDVQCQGSRSRIKEWQ